MFGWFKRTDSTQKTDVAKQEVRQNTAPSEQVRISKAELQLLVQARFKANAGASLFYAQCAGMKEKLLSDSAEFASKVLTVNPTDLTKNNIERAVDHLLEDLLGAISLELWELVLQVKSLEQHINPSSQTNGKNIALRDQLVALRRKVLALGVQPPYQRYFEKFDINEAILEVCLQRRNDDYGRMKSSIDKKIDVLMPVFSRLKNTSTNKYGDYDPTAKIQELEEFLDYTFEDDDFDFYYTIKPQEKLLDYIESRLDTAFADDIPLDGIDFEHWCADQLSRQGWQASVSKASGDQGLDVMVRRDGCSVAVQCKRYSKPIGNKAVQEVFAAKQFSFADHACVIGTGGFTRSARELAGSTGVVLLEAEAGLQSFSKHFGF